MQVYYDEPDYVECPRCGEYMVPKTLATGQEGWFDGCPDYNCQNCDCSTSNLPSPDPLFFLLKDNLLEVAERERRRRQRRENDSVH